MSDRGTAVDRETVSRLTDWRDDGFVLSDDPSRIDLERVQGWLTQTYWARGVTIESLRKRVDGSRAYGVFDPTGAQVAFARAVTDDASYAWVCDVYVDESVRGRGIGQWLVGGLVDHLRGHGVQRFVLATKDAHGVYEKVGFASLLAPSRYMEIDERSTRPLVDTVE